MDYSTLGSPLPKEIVPGIHSQIARSSPAVPALERFWMGRYRPSSRICIPKQQHLRPLKPDFVALSNLCLRCKAGDLGSPVLQLCSIRGTQEAYLMARTSRAGILCLQPAIPIASKMRMIKTSFVPDVLHPRAQAHSCIKASRSLLQGMMLLYRTPIGSMTSYS